MPEPITRVLDVALPDRRLVAALTVELGPGETARTQAIAPWCPTPIDLLGEGRHLLKVWQEVDLRVTVEDVYTPRTERTHPHYKVIDEMRARLLAEQLPEDASELLTTGRALLLEFLSFMETMLDIARDSTNQDVRQAIAFAVGRYLPGAFIIFGGTQ